LDQRVSVITLGVPDVGRAQAFYEALGWQLDAGVDDENDDIAFFQAGGFIVSLWDRKRLAEDSGVKDGGSWAGVTFGYYVGSSQEVDRVLAKARSADATITRPADTTFWRGYPGVFLDPDGHPWEVAHNPDWSVREDGSVSLNGGA
jgi:catechol 2,3-dioxygenase-like lactoylglutathione lyase family enzyme